MPFNNLFQWVSKSSKIISLGLSSLSPYQRRRFFIQVFHAAPVDEDEIGHARLAELKVAKTKDNEEKKPKDNRQMTKTKDI